MRPRRGGSGKTGKVGEILRTPPELTLYGTDDWEQPPCSSGGKSSHKRSNNANFLCVGHFYLKSQDKVDGLYG